MSIKYLVFGGMVTSKSDSDEHFISAGSLCELYKVKSSECIFDNPSGDPDETESRRKYLIRKYPEAIILRPKYNGDYEIKRGADKEKG